MNNWIDINKDKQHVAREKAKAQKLKKSQWWRDEIGKGVCYYCGKKFSPKDLTMDHIVPISRGGKSTKGNIAPCCKECNNKKKYMTPADILIDKMKEKKSEE
jgi:5-methylcytosine-specific restriction endonuclease McrA